MISTVVGDGVARFTGDNGPATSASITQPADIAVDSANGLYLIDSVRIRTVNRQGIITTFAGAGQSFADGPVASAFLVALNSLAFDSRGGRVAAVAGNRQIRRIAQSTITSIAGSTPGGCFLDGIPATTTSLIDPNFVAVDSRGNVLVSDQNDNRV
ncbi:MAG: hypothetical protein FJW36_23985 [Acidobacteria bacterium]|nr:hypothetical protein [Acidobacteriota bacterium]